MSILDEVSHVQAELLSYSPVQKQAGGNVHVLCPFHDENTPSCSVNLDRGAKVPVGTFYCYGCGEKGTWNKFATKTSLKQLKDYQHFNGDTGDTASKMKDRRSEVTGVQNLTIERLFNEVGNEVIPWPKEVPWRNYSGKLIRRIGGYCFNDKYRDELMLVFPVYINNRYRGGVRAFMDKQENGLSYLTLKGNWVASYGLLGYDYVMDRDLWGCKSLVLVEGPRDWLRLIKNKIPSCAMLGALLMDDKKMALLVSMGIKTLYVLPDNDHAGSSMAKRVKKFADAAGLRCKHLKLPREKDDKGKLIKLDPDNAPQSIINEIKKIAYKKGS